MLAEMSRQHGITGLLHLGGSARSLIRADSPEADLPLLRVLEDVFPTELGGASTARSRSRSRLRAWPPGAPVTAGGRVVGREVEDAIDRRTAL